ncbi:MAG: hypothetical protein K8H88_25260 [Sandaracinaceae bacterium]|nr:hypothetical protein [Sandaracinaceae bacterium]
MLLLSGASRGAACCLAALLIACSGTAGPMDAGRDATTGDAATDAGAGADAGASGQWAHCPSASGYVGDPAWAIELRASEGAIYCGTYFEGRTLAEELAAKVMLRVVPGVYRLPATDLTAPFFLPLCLDFGDAAPPTTLGTGTLTHETTEYMGRTYHRNTFQVALTRGRIEGRLDPVRAGGALEPMVLDGRPLDPFSETDTYTLNYCLDGGECWDVGARQFDSCTYDGTPPQLHHVMLEGGSEVHFELRIGQSAASTEPGAFVRASGRFAGVDFDQRDYWHLVYNPAHHHFERDFAVLFDAPIDGACGLEVIQLDPGGDSAPDRAFAVDCTLGRLREVGVLSHTWERPVP